MRKLVLIIVAAIALTLTSLTVCSCDKLSTSLAGTSWTASQNYGNAETVNYTLSFAKTEFTLKASKAENNSSLSFTFFGTYIYDDPIVKLIITIDDDGDEGDFETLHGIREGNTISFEPDGPVFKRKK